MLLQEAEIRHTELKPLHAHTAEVENVKPWHNTKERRKSWTHNRSNKDLKTLKQETEFTGASRAQATEGKGSLAHLRVTGGKGKQGAALANNQCLRCRLRGERGGDCGRMQEGQRAAGRGGEGVGVIPVILGGGMLD